jgi:hypothetical protein
LLSILMMRKDGRFERDEYTSCEGYSCGNKSDRTGLKPGLERKECK